MRDRYKFLLDSIRGILFFGTPHRGSSLATWSTLLGSVVLAVSFGTMTNLGLSKDLQSHSIALQEISKSFVDRAKNLQIVSFYETDKMDLLNCRVKRSFSIGVFCY
jgi:protein SERAC1